MRVFILLCALVAGANAITTCPNGLTPYTQSNRQPVSCPNNANKNVRCQVFSATATCVVPGGSADPTVFGICCPSATTNVCTSMGDCSKCVGRNGCSWDTAANNCRLTTAQVPATTFTRNNALCPAVSDPTVTCSGRCGEVNRNSNRDLIASNVLNSGTGNLLNSAGLLNNNNNVRNNLGLLNNLGGLGLNNLGYNAGFNNNAVFNNGFGVRALPGMVNMNNLWNTRLRSGEGGVEETDVEQGEDKLDGSKGSKKRKLQGFFGGFPGQFNGGFNGQFNNGFNRFQQQPNFNMGMNMNLNRFNAPAVNNLAATGLNLGGLNALGVGNNALVNQLRGNNAYNPLAALSALGTNNVFGNTRLPQSLVSAPSSETLNLLQQLLGSGYQPSTVTTLVSALTGQNLAGVDLARLVTSSKACACDQICPLIGDCCKDYSTFCANNLGNATGTGTVKAPLIPTPAPG